ncbi:MAG: protease modulator HflK [bacterium]|nr:protease modulator HflK [bacterium]
MVQVDSEGRPNSPRFTPPGITGRLILVVVPVVVVLLLIAQTGFYEVEPEEVGVVLRFGARVGESPPGRHWKLPLSIDRVIKVPAQRQLTQEFGFRSQRSDLSVTPADGVNMVTGDLQVVVVEWMVHYRIVDLDRYLFRGRNVEATFRDMSEGMMSGMAGDRTADEMLTGNREEIATVAQAELRELGLYETGITADQVVIRDVRLPAPVQAALETDRESTELLNKAQAEWDKAEAQARGEAEQTIREAESHARDRVAQARREAARFTALYHEYRQAPEATCQRLIREAQSGHRSTPGTPPGGGN